MLADASKSDLSSQPSCNMRDQDIAQWSAACSKTVVISSATMPAVCYNILCGIPFTRSAQTAEQFACKRTRKVVVYAIVTTVNMTLCMQV